MGLNRAAQADHGGGAPAVMTSIAYRHMTAYCLSAVPEEACGALVATAGSLASGGSTLIDGILPIRNNATNRRHHFAFHPDDWVQAYYAARKNRQSIVGFFHSHPASDPVPSASDEAGWPNLSPELPYTYWIVSLSNAEQPSCNAYRRRLLEDGSSIFAQVSIQIA